MEGKIDPKISVEFVKTSRRSLPKKKKSRQEIRATVSDSQDREEAIQLALAWTDLEMEHFTKPTRRGTPKGLPIGFSKKKKKAALLSVLYPNGYPDLATIAKTLKVSHGVFRMWRTEAPFQAEMEVASARFAQSLFNLIENCLVEYKKYQLSNPEESHIMLGRALRFLGLLRFFNESIFEELMLKATKKITEGNWIYAVFAPSQHIHRRYQTSRFRRWGTRALTARELFIGALLDQLADPKARAKHDDGELQALKETIKKEMGGLFTP